MPEVKFRSRLVAEVNPQGGEKILEFGFGTGQNLIIADQKNSGAQLFGLDIDPKVREIARRKLMKHQIDIQLDLYDGGSFPYPNDTYDKVF